MQPGQSRCTAARHKPTQPCVMLLCWGLGVPGERGCLGRAPLPCLHPLLSLCVAWGCVVRLASPHVIPLGVPHNCPSRPFTGSCMDISALFPTYRVGAALHQDSQLGVPWGGWDCSLCAWSLGCSVGLWKLAALCLSSRWESIHEPTVTPEGSLSVLGFRQCCYRAVITITCDLSASPAPGSRVFGDAAIPCPSSHGAVPIAASPPITTAGAVLLEGAESDILLSAWVRSGGFPAALGFDFCVVLLKSCVLLG